MSPTTRHRRKAVLYAVGETKDSRLTTWMLSTGRNVRKQMFLGLSTCQTEKKQFGYVSNVCFWNSPFLHMHDFQITIVFGPTKFLKDSTPWHHGENKHTDCLIPWWGFHGKKRQNMVVSTRLVVLRLWAWRKWKVATHPSLSEDYVETYASWWV